MQGVIAPETANNAAIGGASIPMLCLALPGSPPAAVMLSALQLQGIRPGPMLTSTNPTFTYEMAILLILGSVILWVVGVLIASNLLPKLLTCQMVCSCRSSPSCV